MTTNYTSSGPTYKYENNKIYYDEDGLIVIPFILLYDISKITDNLVKIEYTIDNDTNLK